MEATPLRLIQLSDIHLFQHPGESLLGVNTSQSFDALLELIKSNSKNNDLMIVSGDMAQDGSPVTYKKIAERLNKLNFPVYCTPGNHDDPNVMTTVYPIQNVKVDQAIIQGKWQIILLNSQKTKSVEGYLAKDQFDFMQKALEANPNHFSVIVFHHQPVPVGCAWLDKLGLTNAEQLWDFLKKYPQVRTILFGHVHQEHQGKRNGIHYYSSPSSCIQFKPNSENFLLDNIPPGYRWVELYPNGDLKTGVVRLPHYIGEFQADAKGY